jgi:hypothetical protein
MVLYFMDYYENELFASIRPAGARRHGMIPGGPGLLRP